MNFPRYFDVTLDGERYPTLVEVATDREVELWDPHGWKWVGRLTRTFAWGTLTYEPRSGWIAVGVMSADCAVAFSTDGVHWTTDRAYPSRLVRLRRWLSDALQRPAILTRGY